ncbi:MAG: tRNA pseudouridine(55) synthase TruB [Actinomycetota bacterium]|nr:tRNA pseudouridine(55) synthase TruB [Actinomycetota bacterium]
MNDVNSDQSGFIVVDKEPGWTSHDVVARARKKLNTRKVGHSGTLDPPATGILILGVGRATRLLKFITDLPKRYTATMVLGTETTTLDAEGEITNVQSDIGVSLENLQQVATQFVGAILQTPPMVSAVKVDGKRLYEIAREGREIERKPRSVHVHHISIEHTSEKDIYKIHVTCGSGTYIRSLVSDIAQAAGTIAHVGSLRRNSIGSFNDSDANTIEEIEVIRMESGLRDYSQIVVNEEDAALIRVGNVFQKNHFDLQGIPEPWALTDEQGKLLAVYKLHKGGTIKPDVVIPAVIS